MTLKRIILVTYLLFLILFVFGNWNLSSWQEEMITKLPYIKSWWNDHIKNESLNQWIKKMERKHYEANKKLHDACINYSNKANLHQGPLPWTATRQGTMLVDDNHKLAYCLQNKVGSSTWLFHFYTLMPREIQQNIPSGLINTQNGWAINKILGYFNAQIDNGENMGNLIFKKKLFAFSFVRHPFHRLISAYKDLVLENCTRARCGDHNTAIELMGYTQWYNESHTFPAFVNLVLDEYKNDKCHGLYLRSCKTVNIHWKPLSSKCSYCNVPYSVIGRLETFEEDTKYITMKSGVILNHQTMENADKSKSEDIVMEAGKIDEDKKYFSKLKKEKIEELLIMYKMDFDLFGYDAEPFIRYGI